MKRRTFLSFFALGVCTPLFCATHATQEKKTEAILAGVQELLLPKTKHMPSASEINALGFLRNALKSEHMDSDDRDFILEGAIEFHQYFPNFLEANAPKRLALLKKALKKEYFEAWCSLLMYYGLEAMFSDPIYGGNRNELGWKAVSHIPGEPRPKRPYGAIL